MPVFEICFVAFVIAAFAVFGVSLFIADRRCARPAEENKSQPVSVDTRPASARTAGVRS